MSHRNYVVRKFKNRLFFVLCLICVMVAVVPLLSILFEVIARGISQINWTFLTGGGLKPNGTLVGIGPAIQGSLIIIGLTSLIGVPIGILSGIYLAEFGENKYASFARTVNNVLTEFPSIVVGITGFSIIVVALIGTYSPIAGAIALSFILIPIVARTTEEAMKLVPNSSREAALALGAHKWRSTFSVVIPAARSGMVTGILLAVARIAGESAPLLFTILGNSYFFKGFNQPMDALPIRIYYNAGQPSPEVQAQAWGAALILILIVLALNIGVRVASRGKLRR